MIWQIDLLNDEKLNYIKDYYEEHLFESGVKSNPNTNLKNNLMMKDNHEYRLLHNYYTNCLTSNQKLQSSFVVNKFSQSYFLWYKDKMFYDYHIDNFPIAGVNANLSMTVFLNDPDEYEGGELVIKTGNYETKHKPKAGTAIIYNTGLWHKICPVKKGDRKVVVGWIESMIRDTFMRSYLIDYGLFLDDMTDSLSFDLLNTLEQFRINLVREYGSV